MTQHMDPNEMLKTAQDKFSQMSEGAIKGYEELSTLNKETVDALVQSGNIVAKGTEDLSKRAIAYAQSSFQNGVDTAKSMVGCKNLNELINLQTDYARSSYDKFVAEATTMSDLSMKLYNEAFTPLQSAFNSALVKAKDAGSKMTVN